MHKTFLYSCQARVSRFRKQFPRLLTTDYWIPDRAGALWDAIFSPRGKRHHALYAGRVARQFRSRLFMEPLEDRRLLSVTELISEAAVFSDTAGSSSSISGRAMSADGRYVAFVSSASNVISGETVVGQQVYRLDRLTGEMLLASRATGATGTIGNSTSYDPVLSANGAVIAFRSQASNLVSDDSNFSSDIFVRNLATDTTTLVSRASGATGTVGNNGTYGIPVLSANGTVVAFSSSANNLVTGDTNNTSDIFVRNLAAETTTLVSRATGVTGTIGNNGSDSPVLNADGTVVTFSSHANNLVDADYNGAADVFVRDLTSSQTELASQAVVDSASAGESSSVNERAVSANGRYVAFVSSAANLVSGMNPISFSNVYRLDRLTGEVLLVSRTTGAAGTIGNNNSYNPVLSADGTVVAFSSHASNLATGDTNFTNDIFVRNLATETTTLVSRETGATGTVGNSYSYDAVLSADGTVVAFRSRADNLATGDTNFANDIFVRSLATETTTLVSRASGATGLVSNSNSYDAVLSADGTVVAFTSYADNLATEDTNSTSDIFVRNLATETTTLVSRETGATGTVGNRNSYDAVLSADGTVVAFRSRADNLATGDTNGRSDIFVRHRATETTTLVSRETGATGTVGNSGSYNPVLSADGTVVAFTSQASNLATDDTNFRTDIFVRDLATETTTLVSRETGDTGTVGNNSSYSPAISADGTVIAFSSRANNLATDDINFRSDIFVRDLAADTTTLVSRALGATGTVGNSGTYSSPVLSADGTVVAFHSSANNLVDTDYNGVADVFVRDLNSSQSELASRAAVDSVTAGGNSSVSEQAVSADGRYVAFVSSAANLVSGMDPTSISNVYRMDRLTGEVLLVSRETGATGTVGNSSSYNPVLSADGTVVAFTSQASNLATDDTNFSTDIFVRDLATETTALVSRETGATGTVGNNRSYSPVISADGTVVAFRSRADNLATGDINGRLDIFVRDLTTETTTLVSRETGATGTVGNSNSYNPVLSADGTVVAFNSSANNLVVADHNGADDVFVRELTSSQTELVSRAAIDSVTAGGSSSVSERAMSADGRYIAFASSASNLISGETVIGQQVYRLDRLTGEVLLVSRATGAIGVIGNSTSANPVLSADGSVVAFSSSATNLATGDTNFRQDIFVRNLATETTTLVSRETGATGTVGDNHSYNPVLSADGTVVAFSSRANNLATDDTNFKFDIFVRNLADDTTTLVSRASGATGTVGIGGTYSSPVLSDEGNIVAFDSDANNLADGDTNGTRDIFVRNLAAETTTLVSRATGATGAIGNNASYNPVLSANGSVLAFSSRAYNLAPGDNSLHTDIFVRNLATETTTLVSRQTGATGTVGNSGTYSRPMVSADGTVVAFSSQASNLATGDTNHVGDIFVRNLAAESTTLVSRETGATGTVGNSGSYNPVLSADGTVVAFISRANNLAAGNANFTSNIFIRNLARNTTRLVSRATGATGTVGNDSSYNPVLSADGTVVAFNSRAINLLADDLNSAPDVFVRILEMPLDTEISTDASNNLVIHDTAAGAKNDRLKISFVGGLIRIEDQNGGPIDSDLGTGSGTSVIEINPSSFAGSKIIINGHEGNDTLAVDSSLIASGKDVEFHGAGGNDVLSLVGSALDTMRYSYANANDGSVQLDPDGIGASNGTTINYTGLDPVTSSIATTIVELTYTGDNETITVTDAGSGNTTVTSTLGETTTFVNPTNLLRIRAQNGDDTVNVDSLASGYATLEIAGDDVTDMVNLNGAITLLANHGVSVSSVGSIYLPNSSSDITTSGTGTVSLTAAKTIRLFANSSINTVNGGITLSANEQATPTSGNFIGIAMQGATVTTAGSGEIQLGGRGGDTDHSNNGVRLSGSRVESTASGATAGMITIDGTGGTGTSNNYGVAIYGGLQVTSVDGNIKITGHGGDGPGGAQYGVHLEESAISSTGTGAEAATITIDGAGGDGTSSNQGVQITGAQVTSVDGDIQITGHGGGDGSSFGVNITSSSSPALVSSTGTTVNAATITIDGIGGDGTSDSYGVQLNGPLTQVTSVAGEIQIIGQRGSGSFTHGVFAVNNAAITSTGSADAWLISDSIEIQNAAVINVGAGNSVTLRQKTTGKAINLGGADSAARLGLNDAELDLITAGTVIIGNANSGQLTVSSAITVAPALELNATTANLQANLTATAGLTGAATTVNMQNTAAEIQDAVAISAATGATINIAAGTYAGSVDATSANVTFVPGASPGKVTINGGLTLDGDDELEMEINGAGTAGTDYDQFVVTGTATLGGATLDVDLNYTPAAGDVITLIDAATLTGTFAGLPNGSVVVSPLKIVYEAGTANVLLNSNAPPVAGNDTATVVEDGSVSTSVLTNDNAGPAFENQALTIAAVTQGTHGSVANNGNGTITYTPAANFNGSDSYTYTIQDSDGATATATVNITVTPVNDPPIALATVLSTPHGTAIDIDLRTLVSDLETPDNSLVFTVNGASQGSVSLVGGNMARFTPATSYSGPASFTYTVADTGDGTALSKSVGPTTISVTVAPPTVGTNVQVSSTMASSVVAGSGSGNLVYKVTIKNAGPLNITNFVVKQTGDWPTGVVVKSIKPSSGTFSGSPTNGTWTISSLQKSKSVTLEIAMTVGSSLAPAANAISLTTAAFSANPGLINPSDDTTTRSASIVTSADVSVTKSAPKDIIAGASFIYNVTVKNSGPGNAHNVVLTDLLPSSVTFVSQVQKSGPSFALSNNANSISNSINLLSSGASATFEILVTSNPGLNDDTKINNSATVSTLSSDPKSSNNKSSATTTAENSGAALSPSVTEPGKQDLVIGGTSKGDKISVTPSGSSLKVTINGKSQGTFKPTGTIVVYARAGNDDISIDGDINLPAILYGGSGDDEIDGGGGPTILLGESGHDELNAGSRRTVLIGGTGRDNLNGGSADDVLIGGSTSLDTDHAALMAVLNAWNSNVSYSDRVADISASLAAIDDLENDDHDGNSGRDLFFNGLGDTLQDVILVGGGTETVV